MHLGNTENRLQVTGDSERQTLANSRRPGLEDEFLIYFLNMGTITSHRELIVWQKSMDLAVIVRRLSQKFPSSELYRIVSQMTRSAASVPANIAEGHSRGSMKDYSHFLSICKGFFDGDGNLLDALSSAAIRH